MSIETKPIPVGKADRIAALITAVALFGRFVCLVRPTFRCWFDADDLMNLHYYWSRSWPALLKGNLAFWTTYYRPAAGLFYLPIYDVWGFHPLPFHIVAFLILCVDFWLMAVVVRQLTGSAWAALPGLMLVAINPSLAAAYFDTGSIYDVLAFLFFWIAFAWYVHIRQSGRTPTRRELAGLICVFVAALDSKEIAVVLPVAVALYELIWHPPGGWRPAQVWKWARHIGAFVFIGVLLNVVYLVGKRYGAESLWRVEAYQPHYSFRAYFESQAHFLRQLIYAPVNISRFRVGKLLGAMVAIAVLTRRRDLLWAVIFLLLSVLPLAFIPPRGGFAYMIPSIGWAVYGGGLLAWLIDLMSGRRIWLRRTVQAAVLLAVFLWVARWQGTWIGLHAHAAQDMQGRYRRYIEQIHALIPNPRKGVRVLLLSDAEGRDDWDVHFLMRLYYGDRQMQVDRVTVWHQNKVTFDPASYDYSLDWVDGHFELASHK